MALSLLLMAASGLVASARGIAEAALVRSVKAETCDREIRVLIEVVGAVSIRDFTLDDPPRVVVDLIGARNACKVHSLQIGVGPIRRARLGQPEPQVTRIVLDASEPINYRLAQSGGLIILTAMLPSVREPESKRARQFEAKLVGFTSDKGDQPTTKYKADSYDEAKLASKGEQVLPKGATIVVGDRPLAGPASLPEQRGSRIFLPVVGIARALGDAITVKTAARRVEVRRQSGAVAEFLAQLNQVLENGSVILVVSGAADVIFPPNPEELLLPLEIVAALLDVSIVIDKSAKVVRITRGQIQDSPISIERRSSWEIFQAEYIYNLGLASNSTSHNFAITSSGRIGDGRFNLMANFNQGTGQPPPIFRRGSFIYERPDGKQFVGGDLGTGTDLLFLSAAIRGASFQQPIGQMRLNIFGGRSPSNIFRPAIPVPGLELPPDLEERRGLVYDTNVFGGQLTWSQAAKGTTSSMMLSSGAMYFDGPGRSGLMFTSGLRYHSRRNRFNGDLGFGNFSGIQIDGSRVNGPGFAFDISDSFNLLDSLTLQGRFSRVDPSFLGPQMGGSFAPMKLWSSGVSWRPMSWLGASVSAQKMMRLDVTAQEERSATATLSVTPNGPFPTIMFTHTRADSSLIGRRSYTLINATKDLNRWRIFSNFLSTQTSSFSESLSMNLTAGASVWLDKSNQLQFSLSKGSQGAYGAMVDYFTQSLFSKRASIGAGFGYAKGGGGAPTISGRLMARLELPRQHIFQLTYSQQSISGPLILIELRGPFLFRARRELSRVPISEINSYGSFYGRVYQDINLNGKFDPGVDSPQANVKLRVDGTYLVVTDQNGEFRVENLKAGDHQVYLDLLSVRADLTILDDPHRSISLRPGHDLLINFRLVRSGRLSGVVWLDQNNNGELDPGEEPLADVRVMTGSGRDTLTNSDGEFLIGDLPSGEHYILVDEKTLPEGMISAAGTLRVIVKPGEETKGIKFPIVPKPVEIKLKQFYSTKDPPRN
jgi:hypothetical protein